MADSSLSGARVVDTALSASRSGVAVASVSGVEVVVWETDL
jgi:hypothetical protein